MNGRIVHGDALRELPKLDAESAQVIVADPPYFQVLDEEWDQQWRDAGEYLAWSLDWLAAAMRILREDGLLFCFGQLGKREHTFLHLMSEATRRWQFHDLITWDRVVGYSVRRDSFTPATEHILVLRKGDHPFFQKDAVREPYDEATIARYLKDKRYKNLEARRRHLDAGKFATNVWRIPSLKGASNERCGHPSQKPVALIERIIMAASREGDLVVDPFLGSGTTGVVAERSGRQWFGIEADGGFCKLAARRISVTGSAAARPDNSGSP